MHLLLLTYYYLGYIISSTGGDAGLKTAPEQAYNQVK